MGSADSLWETSVMEKRFISEMKSIASELDMSFIMREVSALTDIEYPQTFKARANSTDYVEALLKREGYEDVLRVDFPADGKTAYHPP